MRQNSTYVLSTSFAEMRASEIQYRHAYNAKGKIIDVTQLERSTLPPDEAFTCISCGNPLIPKLGEIKQKHFCHKQVQNCSSETYLHKLAKETFAREYQACLKDKKPFYISLHRERICNAYETQYKRVCHLGRELEEVDLTQRYTKVEVEKACNGFIADILLSDESGQQKLLIEIKVTHEVSQEKKDSGLPIIEIAIEDEEDIRCMFIPFFGGLLQKLINIHPRPDIRKFCNIGSYKCAIKFGVYVVFKFTGEDNLFWIERSELDEFRKGIINRVSFYKEFKPNALSGEDIAYKIGAIEAWKKGVKIRSCWLCRYHCNDWGDKPYCQFRKESYDSSEAGKCSYYRPDPKRFPKQYKWLLEGSPKK